MSEKLALTLPGGTKISDPTNFKFSSGNITDILNSLVRDYVFYLAGILLLLAGIASAVGDN